MQAVAFGWILTPRGRRAISVAGGGFREVVQSRLQQQRRGRGGAAFYAVRDVYDPELQESDARALRPPMV